MARCGCSSTCSCIIQAGPGVAVTGAGTAQAPYVISGQESGQLTVVDTPTVNETLSGTGTTTDPYRLSADVVVDPSEDNLLVAGPNGLSVSCDAVADCAPAGGSLTVGCGLSGTGSPASPLHANTAPWPFDCPDTTGGAVYCASDGSLRVDPLPLTITAEVDISPSQGLTDVCSRVPTANVETVIASQDSMLTVVNPDPCRDMLLDVQAGGRLRISTNDDADGVWLNALGFDLVVDGVDSAKIAQIGHSQQGSASQDQPGDSWWQRPCPLITIPPGGSVTLGIRVTVLYDTTCHFLQAIWNYPALKIIGRTL